MTRYTKKNDKNYGCKMNGYMWADKSYNHSRLGIDKLGLLEDIEEELGIDLITLFNIYNQLCKQRYVYKKFTNTGEVVKVDLDEGYFVIDFKSKEIERIYYEPTKETERNRIPNWYEFKDYKKTWALDKSDLVNDIVKKE